ncbi:DNA polymerase-3 subunit epsilon [Sphaerotilus hippei]|uniref:DNA polymerase-3 subunit epsilon n=2 Tax=Sphaerotilus hippei TaxID=744406 RepID=A0A318GXQ4_9BURK|nr:3'-5' exonuclease [Sphaerotilus hippei]PXW94704.1 DNA polymerase-3 subunit epsilon [Sphaerotilus hippei]
MDSLHAASPWSPGMPGSSALSRWWRALRRRRALRRLSDPSLSGIFDAPPPDEWVSLDCETTGLDVQRDEIIAIGAVRIAGCRVLTSERLELLVRPSRGVSADSVRVHGLRELDIADGLAPEDALRRLLAFIGSRPLVGYYLEFDVAMLNRLARPLLGGPLPHQAIEVSALYYDLKHSQLPPYQQGSEIDLRFATLMKDLDLPQRPAHNAVNDAVMAALAFIKLRELARARSR